jgi:hypothetical protein
MAGYTNGIYEDGVIARPALPKWSRGGRPAVGGAGAKEPAHCRHLILKARRGSAPGD